jgi:Tol biopolymer transport system component
VIRRGLIFGVLALLYAVTFAASAVATDGPGLAFLHLGTRPAVLEVVSSDAAGGAPVRIAGGGKGVRPLPYPLSSLSWAADGSAVAFAGITSLRGGLRAESRAIFLAPLDGGRPVELPGTAGGLSPVFSPDGSEIAYLRIKGRGDSSETLPNGKTHHVYSHSSIWLTSLDGKRTRQITPWVKDIANWPSSFSPDGSTLGITRSETDGRPAEAVALRIDGSGSTVIAKNAGSPVYSPDGTKIAMVHVWYRPFRETSPSGRKLVGVETASDLFVVNADGSGSTRLTKTEAIEESPAWDPSGRRLAFVRLSRAKTENAFLGLGDSMMEINADGSCSTKVLSAPKDAFLSPAWQPGPGREARPIAC